MSNHPFTSLCMPMPADSQTASDLPAEAVPPGPRSTSVFFAQALNTNLLSVVYTFGMPFGECPMHMTFRMQTTQRETAMLPHPERWSKNQFTCIPVG